MSITQHPEFLQPQHGADPKKLREYQAEVYRDLLWRSNSFLYTRWLGHPVLKTPSDLLWYQEILVECRPDFLVETGTFEGGSALYFASIFDLIGHGEVLSIDYIPRQIPKHPRITTWTGNAADPSLLDKVRQHVGTGKVMISLDDDHARLHISKELELYAQLVTPGQHMVIEDLFELANYGSGLPTRDEFLGKHPEFELQPNRYPEAFSAHGWMKRIK